MKDIATAIALASVSAWALEIALVAILALAGGVAYRWRGMNSADVPRLLCHRWARRALVVGFLALAALVAGAPHFWPLAALALALPGLVIGHGSYFPGGGPKVDDELTAQVVRFFFRGRPLTEPAKAFGMMLTGLAITVPLSFIPGVSVWYALAGILKPVSYLTPYAIEMHLRRRGYEHTAISELVWGAAMTGVLAMS